MSQRIFETGFVIRDAKTVLHLCALQAASKSSFTEAKSLAEGILREIGGEFSLEPCPYPTFIAGRGAFIMYEGKRIGIFGEMSPAVIAGYEMTHPVIAVEMDISGLAAERSGRLF